MYNTLAYTTLRALRYITLHNTTQGDAHERARITHHTTPLRQHTRTHTHTYKHTHTSLSLALARAHTCDHRRCMGLSVSACLFACLSVCLSVCLPVRLHVCARDTYANTISLQSRCAFLNPNFHRGTFSTLFLDFALQHITAPYITTHINT